MGRVLQLLQEDLAWKHMIGHRPLKIRGWLQVIMWAVRNRSFRVMFIHRIAHYAYGREYHTLERLLEIWLFRSCGAEIASAARIDGGCLLPHPQGVIIAPDVIVRGRVVIGQHVTLGGNFGKRDASGRRVPSIGEGCWISAGSIVGGPVEIGAYTIVGANSVVTRSMPPWAVVRGNPAVVMRDRRPEEIPWFKEMGPELNGGGGE